MKDELVITTINSRGLRAIQVLQIIESTHYMTECEICHEEGWHDTYTDGSVHHPSGRVTPGESSTALYITERIGHE
jgi:hypothetical protein